jgi:hypothetical protein
MQDSVSVSDSVNVVVERAVTVPASTGDNRLWIVAIVVFIVLAILYYFITRRGD